MQLFVSLYVTLEVAAGMKMKEVIEGVEAAASTQTDFRSSAGQFFPRDLETVV